MPKTYDLYCSKTGNNQEFTDPRAALAAWRGANAADRPALIVTNQNGSARVAGSTTLTTGPDGSTRYGKSPITPAL